MDDREKIARALRECDEMQFPQMLTDEFIDALADAVLAVLPTYEQVGWAYMLGFDPMPYLSVGEPLPRPEVRDVVPVYVKREP